MEQRTLECDVEKTGDIESGRVITVFCHGQLVSQTSAKLREIVKPLIADGGQIILDLADVSYLDSMGLGTLVGLKASAVAAGYGTLELRNSSARIQELLHLTELTGLFKG